MHPMETAALLKGLVNVSALLWGSQASVTSATPFFPSQGVPAAAALPPVPPLLLLFAVCVPLTHTREAEDDVFSRLLPLVATASAQESSNFNFNDSVTLPSTAKVHMSLWGLGWEMVWMAAVGEANSPSWFITFGEDVGNSTSLSLTGLLVSSGTALLSRCA